MPCGFPKLARVGSRCTARPAAKTRRQGVAIATPSNGCKRDSDPRTRPSVPGSRPSRRRSPGLGGDDAAADLVELDRFEQRLEIALAEALIALALDDLEEDRADHVLGEDLQQQPLAGLGRAVDQDAALAQRRDVVAVARNALVDHLVIGVRAVLEANAIGAQRIDRGED